VKLSTAVRTQTVAVQIGDVAGSNGTERPVFVSPGNGTIVGVSFTNASAIAQSDTDYTTLSVERKTATAGTVKSVTTQVTGGAAFAAFAPQRFVTGLTNTTLAAGDTYSFKKVDTGLGASIDEMLVTVDYAVSE
ncbi:MAG TPA: hypothetical protein VK983_03080, partial [Candidatus Limnocylindrales bacterium]|nr:hypothetical protein [Candidatus Limnocylindrales bacterium]